VGVESGPLPALAVIIAAGVVPFHLWLTALEHRLTPAELQVVLVAQPGLAFLHRWESLHHAELPGASWALAALVVSALAQTGLGLIRTSPRRALNALTFSQSALLVAGAVAHEAGWQAARLLWLSLAVGTLVLHSIAGELERTWGVHRLAPDNGLAAVEPMLHRSFVAMGFLFVGIPGGAAFFAEDLLFHSLVETNVTATVVFLAAVALNAVVFYRLYLGLFAGPTRPRTPHPTLRSPSLGYVYLALLGVVVLGGLWPGLFLSGH
jgi:formate hydrogenlyase subunit 3/multisubunit Na+/H+ antiporter MnhD subunit